MEHHGQALGGPADLVEVGLVGRAAPADEVQLPVLIAHDVGDVGALDQLPEGADHLDLLLRVPALGGEEAPDGEDHGALAGQPVLVLVGPNELALVTLAATDAEPAAVAEGATQADRWVQELAVTTPELADPVLGEPRVGEQPVVRVEERRLGRVRLEQREQAAPDAHRVAADDHAAQRNAEGALVVIAQHLAGAPGLAAHPQVHRRSVGVTDRGQRSLARHEDVLLRLRRADYDRGAGAAVDLDLGGDLEPCGQEGGEQQPNGGPPPRRQRDGELAVTVGPADLRRAQHVGRVEPGAEGGHRGAGPEVGPGAAQQGLLLRWERAPRIVGEVHDVDAAIGAVAVAAHERHVDEQVVGGRGPFEAAGRADPLDRHPPQVERESFGQPPGIDLVVGQQRHVVVWGEHLGDAAGELLAAAGRRPVPVVHRDPGAARPGPAVMRRRAGRTTRRARRRTRSGAAAACDASRASPAAAARSRGTTPLGGGPSSCWAAVAGRSRPRCLVAAYEAVIST